MIIAYIQLKSEETTTQVFGIVPTRSRFGTILPFRDDPSPHGEHYESTTEWKKSVYNAFEKMDIVWELTSKNESNISIVTGWLDRRAMLLFVPERATTASSFSAKSG